MQTLRHAHLLARLVLVWFVLSLGAAVAAPLVQPQSMQLVCTASGAMKLVTSSADGSEAPTLHLMDCSLCVAVAPPPSLLVVTVAAPQPLAFALGRLPAARLAAKTGAPLPPRGPPSSI